MPTTPLNESLEVATFVEEVEISGHIIDSLILPKILDVITSAGGKFLLKKIDVGQERNDPSYALVDVSADSTELLAEILGQIADHGAVATVAHDCRLERADMDGAFPEGFYSSTNQRTEVRLGGGWIEVANQEMDCGICVDRERQEAKCVPMTDVRTGDEMIVGHAGVRVFPIQRAGDHQVFEFMGSSVSSEKPKGAAIREIADELHRARAEGGRILFVGGPAIVHTGSGEHLCELIRKGYVDLLFAGNALATHDIEQATYGTSLGIKLEHGRSVDRGHEHHLRAINRIRRAGSIRQAVESGLLDKGIMYECVQNGTDYLLAGSIRDDGPLPEVVTDCLEAQQRMRKKLEGVTFCMMIATLLHSVAVGNLLPAWVKVVCVDINPSSVIKLADRGSFQTVGLVTDVEPFLRALVQELSAIEQAAG